MAWHGMASMRVYVHTGDVECQRQSPPEPTSSPSPGHGRRPRASQSCNPHCALRVAGNDSLCALTTRRLRGHVAARAACALCIPLPSAHAAAKQKTTMVDGMHTYIDARIHRPPPLQQLQLQLQLHAGAPASSTRSSSSRTPGAGESAGLCSGETGPA